MPVRQSCRRIASTLDALLLSAASAHATGAVLLSEGDDAGAAIALHRALDIWRNLEMPYEEAHACRMMATVCERRGDQDGCRLELDTARRLFTELNARPDLARIAEQTGSMFAPVRRVAQRTGSAGPSPVGGRQDQS